MPTPPSHPSPSSPPPPLPHPHTITRTAPSPHLDPLSAHHRSPYLATQRAQCLAVAQQLLDRSARKVKVTKRRRRDGQGVVMYKARVVAEGDRVVIEGEGWWGSEEEAVKGLKGEVVRGWRVGRGGEE